MRLDEKEHFHLLERVINHSQLYIFVREINEEKDISFVSENVKNLGYLPDDFYSKKLRFQDIIHLEDRELVKDHIKKYSKKICVENFSLEYRLISKNGCTIWVEERSWIKKDDLGNPIRHKSVLYNVDERKRLENKMKETSKKFKAIADYTIDWESWLDVDGKLLWVNPAVKRLTGYSQQECLDMEDYPFSLIVKDHRNTVKNLLKAGIEGKIMGNDLRYKIARKDGSESWISISWSPIFFDNEFGGLRLSIRDVTFRVKSDLVIKRLNDELKALNYSLSHDIRTPLHVISWYSDILVNDKKDKIDEESFKCIEKIKSNILYMNKLINDQLKLFMDNRKELEFKEVDLSLMACEIADNFIKTYNYIDYDFRIETDLKVYADESLMRVLLENLIGNAVKYSSKKDKPIIEFKKIKNESEYDGDIFVVSDNGIGFDMKNMDSLFTMFKRFHNEKEYKGSGIGLATVKRVIKQHGGRIWAKSKPGEGSKFYFYI